MPRKKGKVNFELRKKFILLSIVSEYLKRGRPVSSRLIARKYTPGLSAATVRNIMMDLEDEGYLYQPHTSAGRFPTLKGIRLYVDDLLHKRLQPLDDLVDRYSDDIRFLTPENPAFLDFTTHFLSEVTNYIAVAVTDLIEDLQVKSITLVTEGQKFILGVFVFMGGIVKSVILENRYGADSSMLMRISNYLTETFSGRTLGEIESMIRFKMDELEREIGRIAVEIYRDISREYFRNRLDSTEIKIEGTLNVADYPEFERSEKLKKLLSMFEEKRLIVNVLEHVRKSSGITIILGDEMGIDLDAAVVAGRFSGVESGIVGVVGPVRMNYEMVIPALKLVVERLSES